MRDPAPAHPTPADIIRVPYPTYGPPSSTQPTRFMEFIPTPGFPKKWCFVEFKRCFGFVICRLIWIMPHSWVSFCLSLFKTYDLLMPHSWVAFAYVIFLFQFLCSGFFSLFCTHMLQGSIWYMIKQFRDLFDGF